MMRAPLKLGIAGKVRRLLSVARRISPSNYQDLAQDAWARMLSRNAVQHAQHPQAYLATITRNLAAERARRVRVRGGGALSLDDLSDAADLSVAADQDTSLLLKQVILGLPEIYRDTFVLNRFVGLSYAEIAERQGISVKAVEYRMSRALARCRAALLED